MLFAFCSDLRYGQSWNWGLTPTLNPNVLQVERRIAGPVSSKMYGAEKWLTPLIAEACMEVCPKNPANFNVDNVRVVKIPGSGANSSQLVRGVVIKREPEGTVRSAKKAKVAVFAQGIDSATTETKASHPSLDNSLELDLR